MDFSETSAGGIHSSRRESKRAQKKIENRKAADKRKMKRIITSLKVPLCSGIKCVLKSVLWGGNLESLATECFDSNLIQSHNLYSNSKTILQFMNFCGSIQNHL